MSHDPYQSDGLIGREIAGYEITDFIDSGAASLVFRGKRATSAPALVDTSGAFPLAYPDIAAIKLLAPSLGSRHEELADFQRRFAREAELLKQLRHPHILSANDSGEDEDTGYFYIALPYMEGGSLASAIERRGPLPLSDVAAILAQIADALDYAHAHGIIHRDVKPANILLDAQGQAYLGDFGIVRLLSGGLNLTQRTTIGRVMGSPAYMAPEQFSDTSRIGPLSDLYSLGMVVYQMVTGHLAFETTSWPSLIYKQLSETPASPRSARPELPEPAAAAIMNALEKDPTRRFSTAAAFAQAFALGLQGQWTDELIAYMAAATMPAVTIAAPMAPAVAHMSPTPILGVPTATQTWPSVAPLGRQLGGARWPVTRRGGPRWAAGPWNSIWRGGVRQGNARGPLAAAALLLLVSCVAGVLYLGSNGPGKAPLLQSASGAGSSPKVTRTLPTNTSTPPPSPTATQTPSGNVGVSAPAPTATNTPTPEPSPTATDTPTPSPTATDTPTAQPPSPTPAPTDTPTSQSAIRIGWSDAYSNWIWMAFRHFSPGAYTYTCNYGSGENQTHSIVVSDDIQVWDNADTCYSSHHGETLWVSVGSIMSNAITVPDA
ncbi:MAG TPA: protein kinase [Ktedonobacterales bacterium]|nr:protein kinase [Ktedonobacterales bacterium]